MLPYATSSLTSRYPCWTPGATLPATTPAAAPKNSGKSDYCTFSGTFSVRREDKLIRHSGLLCLDFDHLPDVEGLFPELLQDEYFDTMLLFRSPSGDGLKWIIPTDLTECSHADFFRSVSAYIAETYRVSVDSSGKDVCRACFLPYDPGAYLSPDFSQAL